MKIVVRPCASFADFIDETQATGAAYVVKVQREPSTTTLTACLREYTVDGFVLFEYTERTSRDLRDLLLLEGLVAVEGRWTVEGVEQLLAEK